MLKELANIRIKPKSRVVAIESAIRKHPYYWALRLELSATTAEVFEKVIIDDDSKGHLVFVSVFEEAEDKRVSQVIHSKVERTVVPFSYGRDLLGRYMLSFQTPQEEVSTPRLKLLEKKGIEL